MDALGDIRVIELATGVAGPIVGMFCADFGADVVKVETPDGDPERGRPGFPMWNRGKRSVVIDPGSAEGRAWLRNRIGGADMLITRGGEELAAFGLDGDELLASHPRLILLEMPVYLPGHVPWADGVESAALLGAYGGQFARQSSVSGEPVESVYQTLLYAHGLWASVCAVAALIEREGSGFGQRVTVSGINALQQLTMISLVVDPNAPDPSTAVGGAGRHPTYSRMIAGDGKWFTSGALGPRFEAMFMEVIGLGSIVEDERLGGSLANMVAPENIGWVQKAVEEAVLKQPRQYWLDRLDAVGIPSGPIDGREGWLDHPQVAAMGMRVEVDDPDRGPVVMPGVPINLTATPGAVRGPAPALGEHNDRVAPWPAQPRPAADARPLMRSGPLSGIRVVNSGPFLASPYAGCLLSALGADVIKVEPREGDPFRKPAYGANRGMRSIAIDLKHPDSIRAFHKIIEGADVFIDGLRPGVTKSLGIDYDSLKAINPGIVTMSLSAFGQTGPLGGRGGVDMVLQGMAGMMAAEGGDGEPIVNTISVCDISTASMSSLTIALALFHRLRTGEGQRTWDTLLGTATYLQSAEIIRFEGRPPAIVGGVDFQGDGAFDRMYRAADGWVRIAAPDAPAKIASALEIPEEKLADKDGAIAAIGAAIIDLSREEATRRLNRAGVPSASVRKVTEVLRDPRLCEAGFAHVYPSDNGGFIATPGRIASFSRTEWRGVLKPPGIGEHSVRILEDAGIDPATIDQLIERRAVAVGGPMPQILPHAYR
ncbi:CoA transferase [Sphingomonadales bacterium 56]|uniref:CoA transferase n=1 Tax=Sphingobium indicum TaxID=332055 RepID=A0A4Q4J2J6_9SPHN|nr:MULTISPECIES: CoA transferase [Sphingobium]MBY2930655.1 CoA transferase [Sphingomonadales bacterium 56]MBY2960647.1 CoA transferase [Sphingomonadales bacterium 58]NYI23857.1 crotonobetainyl-CoA:carnitine CoA-transferase CaiB-like acyl-CoA transferase [Sphingobium indicum]RYM00296.1 CoA transferase [Sphingobium indicum]CAD7341643.1 Formyl-CoA:oxalate CoA-transferase [Sphingobium sp. S8]